MKDYYRHTKTGKIYRKFNIELIDATNATDGRQMALYQNDKGDMFTRELSEFDAKFEPCANQEDARVLFKNSRE